MKQLYFFDLDSTLWSFNSKVWIIDKENPSKPILKLSHLDFSLIQDGIYKKDDIKIEYNDNSYYISQELYDRIYKIKHIKEDRIGISFVEFYNPTMVKKIKILLSNIRHLSNKNIDVAILSARFDRKADSKFLADLRLELKGINIGLDKIFYVGDKLYMKHYEKMSIEKVKVILEHFIGYKIDKNKFVDEEIESYDEIHFYDDLDLNIEYALNIQEYLQDLLYKTPDNIYKKIIDRIKNNKLTLYTYLISSNTINKFKINKVNIIEPIKFPIKESCVMKFNEFINEKINN